jgi:hypothetical protein
VKQKERTRRLRMEENDDVLAKAGTDVVEEVSESTGILAMYGIIPKLPAEAYKKLAASAVNIFCSLVEIWLLMKAKAEALQPIPFQMPDGFVQQMSTEAIDNIKKEHKKRK